MVSTELCFLLVQTWTFCASWLFGCCQLLSRQCRSCLAISSYIWLLGLWRLCPLPNRRCMFFLRWLGSNSNSVTVWDTGLPFCDHIHRLFSVSKMHKGPLSGGALLALLKFLYQFSVLNCHSFNVFFVSVFKWIVQFEQWKYKLKKVCFVKMQSEWWVMKDCLN